MKTLIMMPGQGSQKKGMGGELIAKHSAAKAVFTAASEALGYDMEELCLLDPEEKLIQTEFTQPALLTVSIAMWEANKDRFSGKQLLFAGHSLGEISALVAAGRLPFGEAVQLVKTRGQQMQKASPVGKGAMAAILRLEPETIKSICDSLSSGEDKVQPANYNSTGQTVISGEAKKVAEACRLLKDAGGKTIPLKVSAPFHSYLMEPAKQAMRPLIEGLAWKQLETAFIPNVSAEICNSYKSSFLVDQITAPVNWVQTLHSATKYGVEEFVEVGPGKVLSGLAKRELKDKGPKCLHISELDS